MGNPKSLSERTYGIRSNLETDAYLAMLASVLEELLSLLPNQSKSLERDFETLKSRVEHEGLSFLTIALPKLGKAFERSLETGSFARVDGFSYQRGWNIPRLLGGVFRELFDRSGHLVDDIDARLVRLIRVVTLFCYKLDVPYTQDQEEQVVRSFVSTDAELDRLDFDRHCDLLQIARDQVHSVLEGFDPRDIVPKHGPGAVSTGERGDQKWSFRRVFYDIHQFYPFDEFFVVGGKREVTDRHDWRSSLSREESGTAKVCLVPKDSRGPRLISCEPLEYQWIQQGLGRKLMHHLESSRILSGHVNFSDQKINGRLALESSKTGSHATLDLKDASDRVSLELVRRLFPDDVFNHMLACRTPSTRLPSGDVVTLKKFAPMGSALCFPVESLVFFCVAVGGIVRDFGVSPEDARAAVYVYGDDIIVSTRYAYAVISALEDVGLVVNTSKSFIRGKFRESCGVDAFNGIDVTPFRLKTRILSRRIGQELPALVSLFNRIAKCGLAKMAYRLQEIIESRWGKVPFSVRESGTTFNYEHDGRPVKSLFRAMYLNWKRGIRMKLNSRYEVVEVRWYRLQAQTKPTSVDSWPRLLRNLVVPGLDTPDLVSERNAVKVQRVSISLS